MKLPLHAVLLFAAAASSSPVLADHTGPGGGIATGGAINTVSAGTLDEGHFAAAVRWSLATPERLSGAELLARDEAGIDAHSTHSVSTSALGVAYGVTHELTLSAELPYVRRSNIRAVENGSPLNRGTNDGIGDLTLLAKYKLLHGETWAVAVFGGLKVPTGTTGKHDRSGALFETEHQPGTGSWDPIGGVAASVGIGATGIDASLAYQKATTGAQHTRLGNRGQAGIALSHRFGPHEPPHHHDDDEQAHEHHEHGRHSSIDAIVELNGEWEGREQVDGTIDRFSGSRVLWLSPGARFTAESGWSIAGSLGWAAAQHVRASHPDNAWRSSLSLSRSF